MAGKRQYNQLGCGIDGSPEQKLASAVVEHSVQDVQAALRNRRPRPEARQAALFLCGRLGDVWFWLTVAGIKDQDKILSGCSELGKRYLRAEEVNFKKGKAARRAA